MFRRGIGPVVKKGGKMRVELTKGVHANIPQRAAMDIFKKFIRQHEVRFLREAPSGLTVKASLTSKAARVYVMQLFDRAAVDYDMRVDMRKREIVWRKK